MNTHNILPRKTTLGIVGFGAFGQLAARHLRDHFEVTAYDPVPARADDAARLGVGFASLSAVSHSDVVLIAAPVSCFEEVVRAVATACKPGALIVDVGSVKIKPAEIMQRLLPDDVDIIATHPLFGPQSAQHGIAGLKIAVCPLRAQRQGRLIAFLRKFLGLKVLITSPEDHDKQAAMVQGLTHLIAKVLLNMGPLPTRMTTRSFELLSEAISMVQHDSPDVFEAIENANPYAEHVRRRFFGLAADMNAELEAAFAPAPLRPTGS